MEITNESMKKGRKDSLRKPEDLRLFLADIIRKVRKGDMEESKGRTLGYLVQILLRILEGGEFERRLEAIEKALAELKIRY